MKEYASSQQIKQLEKRRGGYFYLEIDAGIVNQLAHKRSTRLICTIDESVNYRCGLNHLGDGNFFIIVASKHLVKLHKELGESVDYRIEEDPDQLGVKIPEVLQVLLDQDDQAKKAFDLLTGGKKRSLIYSIMKIKDIDKQVKAILEFLNV